jgi:hypothetical protein
MEYDEAFLREVRARVDEANYSSDELASWVAQCLDMISSLKDENESLWMMLDEFESSRWTKVHTEELNKSIEERLMMLKLMRLQKGEA